MWSLVAKIVAIGTIGGIAALLAGLRPSWGVAISYAISIAWVLVRGLLVRLAHSAFRAGRWARSSVLYRVASWLMLSGRDRAAARVSRCACSAQAGDYQGALTRASAVADEQVDEATRAALLNNRAYASARLSRDLDQALDWADEAVRLRPALPGFRHTRGVVLIALGRYADAVADLDRVWQHALEGTPLLESERCYDMGMAWRELGEHEYALDYFERALRTAPSCVWAQRAESELGRSPSRSSAVLPA